MHKNNKARHLRVCNGEVKRIEYMTSDNRVVLIRGPKSNVLHDKTLKRNAESAQATEDSDVKQKNNDGFKEESRGIKCVRNPNNRRRRQYGKCTVGFVFHQLLLYYRPR